MPSVSGGVDQNGNPSQWMTFDNSSTWDMIRLNEIR